MLRIVIYLLLLFLAVYVLYRKIRPSKPLKVLYTKWGEDLNCELPLNDYPRPQLKRDSFINLNGPWEYCFNNSNVIPKNFIKSIIVPFSPESILSGVGRQLKPGETLWYRRFFDISTNDGRFILNFGAVDQECTVFINRHIVGYHFGGYLPFSFDITEVLVDGSNEIIVRVLDNISKNGAGYGKQTLQRGGIWYTATSGIWQTVWMEKVPDNYVKSLKIIPEYDTGSVKLNVVAKAPSIVSAKVYDRERMILSVQFSSNAVGDIKLPSFKSWSPESPFLYTLKIELGNDRVESYFGMRKFSISEDEKGLKRLCLNNKPYFHNGLLDQGYWSDGIYTAPSDEALIYDIKEMKSLGFNMLRKHIKIEPLRWYYHCDRLGMIVWQDMVSGGSYFNPIVAQILPFIGIEINDNKYWAFGRSGQDSRNQFYREMISTVEHLYNIVSIAMWVPFNEGWGQFDSIVAYNKIRELDQTRHIDHASGWHDQGGNDFKSYHVYYKAINIKKDPLNRAIILSEFGGYSWGINEHSACHDVFGYKIYKSETDFNNAIMEIYTKEVLPFIPLGLSAAVYTQVSDVEDEVNGLLTYDRKINKCNRGTIASLMNQVTKMNQ